MLSDCFPVGSFAKQQADKKKFIKKSLLEPILCTFSQMKYHDIYVYVNTAHKGVAT